ncbi:MAG: DegT/DnrJ/EryC1/StrS family aminotransferase [Pyrinomonadaceae bacterium]
MTSTAPHSSTGIKVPLLDLQAQYAPLRTEVLKAVERVFDSQQFLLGSEVKVLEEEVARYSQTRHAVGCTSGTDALLLALMALDIKAGDEVVTTPYSFFATASSIVRVGARPVFVDIEANTYNIDVDLIPYAITPRTRAIMPVHLYGQCAEMNELLLISKHYKLPIIEDAAQAIGAEDTQGRRAGAMGAIGCFSFYPTKNLGGAGDGGMLVTNDDALAERLRSLRVHGETVKYHHKFVGINGRLDAIQAAVLRVKLPHLDRWTEQRQANAATYDKLFADANLTDVITLPFARAGVRHIFNQYVIRVPEKRDGLREHLHLNNIGTEVYYPVPLHLQECFRSLGYKAGDFPEAERAAGETLALPVYPELTFAQQCYVVASIARFFEEARP